jgi:tetratricopeptide (TPR) repeat protein
MNLLHITDLGQGKVQVSWKRGAAIPRQCPAPIPFADPLTPEHRKSLRWYLEDYLRFPYGAEAYRAQQVEARMAEWGAALFRQLFPKLTDDPDPHGFYQEAVREGLESCELCVSSEDADFLNIPWELLHDPTPGRGYLALCLAGLYRQRTGQKIEARQEAADGEPFRILLVIARPYGARDVPLGTVARPVLEALRPLRPGVQLDLLRPPTFDALQRRLNERRGYYQLVHFDGHGVFVGASRGPLLQFGVAGNRGHLAFEKEDGSEHVVNSADLGQALAACKAPLFVLNACQSAEEGQGAAYSSVAAQLLASGAQGVVAMSYSVYATSAARFIERLYERLVAHDSLAGAVAAARRRLHAEPEHESPVGPLELRDWLVPALYQQEERYTPIPAAAAAGRQAAEEAAALRRPSQVCPEGRFGFIGRDYDILRLERALGHDAAPWALLTGIGGTGKTELAFGFARWYAETGGCPGGVFAASFKHKADFGQVLGSIAGYGTDFSRLSGEQQWNALVGYLRENACLLVWDNFETVAGYPAGVAPLATGDEREKLSRFLGELRGGKSRVIITTRKPAEDWLGVACEAVEIGGLTEWDSGQMAQVVLRTVGRTPAQFRDDTDYPRLLKLLKGHPRSLEVVLPHLKNRPPGQVLDSLQHRVDALGEAIEDASLAYAFSQMSPRAVRHFPFLGFFAEYARSGTIASFVGAGARRQPVYESVVGEALDAQGWEAVLEEAAASGLIRSLGNRIYELHPTLAPFLRRQLLLRAGEQALARLDSEFASFYAAWAGHCFESARRADRAAVMAARTEEANLLRALGIAAPSSRWTEMQAILQTLDAFYEARGRVDEWRALRDAALDRVGRTADAGTDRARANLWMYLLGDEANDNLERNELDKAEAAHLLILNYLAALRDPRLDRQTAVGYHQLGMIAEERQKFEEAEQWYRKALEINERLGLERDAANDYHELGIVAQERQKFDEAEQRYRKALEIRERLGLERDAAYDYHQLGRIAEERQKLEEAEQWYRKALEIFERLGLERDAADDYHQLGMIAQERQEFDEAEQWYRKALEIFERLGLERHAAADYHQLGMIAEERQKFEEAEQWYCKALEIRERLGLERDAASDYHQLGMIAQERQKFDEAEQWYRKALEIFERLGVERHAAADYHQLGNIALLRQKFEEAEQWYRKALEISERLGLERYAADDYHQLGIIAQERQKFEEAEQWYRKALEVYERLRRPPLAVNALAQLGVLNWRRGRFQDAVSWLGKALAIAAEYEMRVGGRILAHLARLMKLAGEQEFASAWREAFQQEPPLEALREVLRRIEGDAAGAP